MNPLWSTAISVILLVILGVAVVVWETRHARQVLDDDELRRLILPDEGDTPL